MQLEDLVRGGRDLVVLDLETTGTNVQNDRVVQLAAVKVHADGQPRARLVSLVNPGVPIPAEATGIHGITDADVAGAPSFPDVEPRLSAFVDGCDLGGYNVLSFDLPLLRAEYARHGRTFAMAGRRVVDGMVIFKHFERRTLEAAVEFYTGATHEQSHDALGDVLATIHVVEAQLDRYGQIPRDVPGLADLCYGHRVTADGRIVWRDGVACLGFGAHSGVPLATLARKNRGYLEWMLGRDFADDVKDVVRDALAGRFPVRSAEPGGAPGPDDAP
jgi:DNA polymerase-3 subunit epsilon